MGKKQAGSTGSGIHIPWGFRLFFTTLPLGIVVWVSCMHSTWPINGRAMWTGFDLVFLGGTSVIAAYLVNRHSFWACLPITALAALFAVDMYFDYMTSPNHKEKILAIKLGLCLELPLVPLCLLCAFLILRQLSSKQ